MKYLMLPAAIVAATLGLIACQKTEEKVVVQPVPVPVPSPNPAVVTVPTPVPGPQGPAGAPGAPGAEGAPGASGKSGSTIVVVPQPEERKPTEDKKN